MVSALDRHNAAEVMKNGEICKNLIERLVKELEPPELRERIKDAHECWTKEEKSSLAFFLESVAKLAVDVNQGETARARICAQNGKKRAYRDQSRDQVDGKWKHRDHNKTRHRREK